MGLRRELSLTIGALVLANLILSFGAIGLLARMGPAIERILQENVYSIAAAEDVLLGLTAAEPGVIGPDRRKPIQDALSRAAENITETGEAPALQKIREHLSAAFDGDVAARRTVVEELRQIIVVNREAMTRADAEARRIGRAGAWAAVFVGFTTFVLGLLIGIRLRRRILWPLIELSDVLSAVGHGNPRRRCRDRYAPEEIRDVTRSVNALLDERLSTMHRDTSSDEDLEHEALSKLLERESRPAAIVDVHGEIFRANSAALERLSADDGDALREMMRDIAPADTPEQVTNQSHDKAASPDDTPDLRRLRDGGRAIEVSSLGEHGWLCLLDSP